MTSVEACGDWAKQGETARISKQIVEMARISAFVLRRMAFYNLGMNDPGMTVRLFSAALLALVVGCVGQLMMTGVSPTVTAKCYAEDDLHNHDGSHPPESKDCGTNYMLPGEIARLGSHSFMILGQDDADHVVVEHRSGTPPHNYQFLLRVRLDPDEMSAYQKVLRDPGRCRPSRRFITTKPASAWPYLLLSAGLAEDIWIPESRKDEFSPLFPIRASLQKNADHEGGFAIRASVVPGFIFR